MSPRASKKSSSSALAKTQKSEIASSQSVELNVPGLSSLTPEEIAAQLPQYNPDAYLVADPLNPPERGAEAPDWFYVPGVPPTSYGQFRRSYVLWQELIAPLIVLEFVSGDGSEERDATPLPRDPKSQQKPGKFWIYERVIRPAFYGIYEVRKASVEVDRLVDGRYQRLNANQYGRFPIAPLGVELGIWQGQYQNKFISHLVEDRYLPSIAPPGNRAGNKSV
ncbi:MAG: Uma2 family endonuclease [Cyanobacteriota bacterium]|nr:Uma2 family endonuclease [Cyanobacteriota bacterium]